MQIVAVLLPDFLLIGIGSLIGRRVPVEAWRGIDRINFDLLFPALIFVAAAGRAMAPSDVLVIGGCVWALMLGACALASLLRVWGPERFLDFAAAWQTSWRFNTALGFVAVQSLPPTAAGMMSIAIGTGVPLANLLAVGALSRGNQLGLAETLRRILLNPFLIASASGLAVGLSGLPLPDLGLRLAERLGSAAVPLALLAVGAALEWRAVVRLTRFTAALTVIKLVALPLAAFILGWALGLRADQVAVLTVFCALPTASAAHVLASAFGADPRLPATLIAQSTVFGCLTLPFWIALVT